MAKRIQIVLTVPQSKKLLSKAVLKHPMLQKAWKEGIVVVHPSSTVYFILEELGVQLPEGNRGLWVCGHVRKCGLCLSKPMIDLMMGTYEAQSGGKYPFDLIFRKGVLQPSTPLSDVIAEMGEDDVYVKSVNAIDPDGRLGVLLCVPGGGSIGNIIVNKPRRNYKILGVGGLEKVIPTSIKEAARLCRGLDQAQGVKTSMTVLKTDDFMSEVEAFKILTGCKATPVASGGIDGMEGGYVFILEGSDEEIAAACKLLDEVRDAKMPALPDYPCDECSFKVCSLAPAYDPNYAEVVHDAPLVEQRY